MNEKDLKILEQYDLQIKNIYRGRGAYICETQMGPVLVKEYTGSVQRAELMQSICKKITDEKKFRADCIILNKEEQLISADKDEQKFMVKKWTTGKECDVKNEKDIQLAIANLAGLHNVMTGITVPDSMIGPNIEIVYEKHMKELRKIRNYIREKKKKSEFELYFYKKFDSFYSEAQEAVLCFQDGFAVASGSHAIEKGLICHGDYNQHNVLIDSLGVFTVNFDKSFCGVQIEDLYHFMRKILEKCNWNIDIAKKMLEVYHDYKPLDEIDLQNLYLRFRFPEKFWKIANYYYNSRKSHVFERSTEKLQAIVNQKEEKEKFLNYLYQIL